MRLSLRFRPILGWSLAALFAWACGESGGDGPGPSVADAGSSAGGDVAAGGQPASQSDAGSGGDPCVAAPDSEACQEVPWCGPFGLQEVCGPTPFPLCPTSFADWVERTSCDSVSKLEAYDTTCGGRVLVRYFEHKTESWEFDADETLLSVMVEGDALHECYEGGRSTNWLFGAEPCAAEPSTIIDVCLGAGGAGSAGAGGTGPGEPSGAAGDATTGGVGGAP
jgi:hypothetical protein